jgi:nitrogen regulatory protein P-II 2
MQTPQFKLVTIIADESLKKILEEDIIALGARGYTVTNVEGKGKTGSRDSAWSGENVKIETIVPPSICENILSYVAANYFERYAVIAYSFDVQTIRSNHFM